MTAAPLVLAGRGAVGHALARAVPSASLLAGRDVAAQAAALAAPVCLLLCVPDDAIAGVAAALAARLADDARRDDAGAPSPHALVAHVSGARDLAPLAPLAERGVRIGSWHPLVALPRDADSVAAPVATAHATAHAAGAPFRGITVAIDGPPDVRATLGALAHALGATPLHVPSDARVAWHAAATLVASLPVVTRTLADTLLAGAGLDAADTRPALDALLASVQRNLAATPEAARALTGPVVRGDVATVAAHARLVAGTAHDAAWRALMHAVLAVAAPRLDADVIVRLRDVIATPGATPRAGPPAAPRTTDAPPHA